MLLPDFIEIRFEATPIPCHSHCTHSDSMYKKECEIAASGFFFSSSKNISMTILHCSLKVVIRHVSNHPKKPIERFFLSLSNVFNTRMIQWFLVTDILFPVRKLMILCLWYGISKYISGSGALPDRVGFSVGGGVSTSSLWFLTEDWGGVSIIWWGIRCCYVRCWDSHVRQLLSKGTSVC